MRFGAPRARRRLLISALLLWLTLLGIHALPRAAHVASGAGLQSGSRSTPSSPSPIVVALGDSITYGTEARHRRGIPWPADLARRLRLRVVNAGIPGNAVAVPSCRTCGPPATARLAADVLSVPGVRALIVLEGINDTIHGGSAAEIIAGLREIAARAHAHGIRVIAGTLLPWGTYRRHTAARERMRQAVNAWIRSSRVFDGVIDFSAIMAAPHDAAVLNPAYDSGDGLHPNSLGYRVMANAIPLSYFAPLLYAAGARRSSLSEEAARREPKALLIARRAGVSTKR